MNAGGNTDLRGKRVLIIDDEAMMCSLVSSIFAGEGALVHTALSGEEGLRIFFEQRPDVVILDLLLPGIDGLEVCRLVRQFCDVPVIMLTCVCEDKQAITALNVGADDYLTKPFNCDVLVARVRAALRRSMPGQAVKQPDRYDDGYLSIDLDAHRVEVAGTLVDLTVKELDLLAYLFRNGGRVCTFSQILDCVWGSDYRSSAEYVHVLIWRLRQKLEDKPKKPTYLINVHGMGYRFESHYRDLHQVDQGAFLEIF